MKELSWRERGRLWLRLGLRLLLVLLVLWALVRLGPPMVSLFAPFLLAFLVAWMLSPLVRWLHQKLGLSRRLLTLAVLLLVFVLLAGLLWWLGSVAVGEIVSLAGDWEELILSLQSAADSLGQTLSRAMALLPAGARETADSLVAQLFNWLETVIPQVLSSSLDAAASMAKGLPSFAVATIVFIMACYFIIADYPQFQAFLAQKLPRGPLNLLSLVKRAISTGFGGYLKAQLILSVGVFAILLVGFLLIHQPYALLLALGLAVLDFIPIIGSGTVMVPWAVIDLILGDYRHALGLIAVWGLVAIFRRVGEPKVLGDQTGLSPLLSLASVYVGMKVHGVLGMILGPILCLVAIHVLRSGILAPTLSDLRLMVSDLSALLRDGIPDRFRNSNMDF